MTGMRRRGGMGGGRGRGQGTDGRNTNFSNFSNFFQNQANFSSFSEEWGMNERGNMMQNDGRMNANMYGSNWGTGMRENMFYEQAGTAGNTDDDVIHVEDDDIIHVDTDNGDREDEVTSDKAMHTQAQQARPGASQPAITAHAQGQKEPSQAENNISNSSLAASDLADNSAAKEKVSPYRPNTATETSEPSNTSNSGLAASVSVNNSSANTSNTASSAATLGDSSVAHTQSEGDKTLVDESCVTEETDKGISNQSQLGYEESMQMGGEGRGEGDEESGGKGGRGRKTEDSGRTKSDRLSMGAKEAVIRKLAQFKAGEGRRGQTDKTAKSQRKEGAATRSQTIKR